MATIDRVLDALGCIRAPLCQGEYDLHNLVANALIQGELAYIHEKVLGPRRRIDFYVDGIGIEVKKGRPALGKLKLQLEKYALAEEIEAIVLVVERNANIPRRIAGKPVHVVSLNRLWGIAL